MDHEEMRPHAAWIINRPRILDRLAAESAQLTIVDAPRGFGKTVLLRQWMNKADRESTAYIYVEPTSGDFWKDALAAATVQGAQLRGENEGPSCREDFGHWAGGLKHPVTVVVDDYQGVTSPQLDEEWTHMLQRAPNLRLLVASRFFYGLGGPLSTAMVPSAIVSADDLRFTDSEVTEALQARHVPGVSAAAGKDASSEWPLILDLRARQATGALNLGGRQILPEEVIYSCLTNSSQRRLAALISVLPWVSVRLLAEALGVNTREVPSALRPLIENGLVTRHSTLDQARYSVTPFMAEFLAGTVNDHWPPDWLRSLKIAHARDSATVYPQEALQFLVDLEFYRSAEDLLTSHLGPLIAQWPQVLVTLRRVPAKVWSQYPIISGTRLLLEVAGGDLAEIEIRYLAQAVLEGARRRLAEGTADYPLVAQTFLVLARRRLGDGEKAWANSLDLWQRISQAELSEEADLDDIKGLAYFVTAQTALLIGENSAARTLFREMLEQEESPLLPLQRLAALAGSAFVMALESRLSEAREYLEQFQEMRSTLVDPQTIPWSVTLNGELASVVLASQSGTLAQERAALASNIRRDGGGEYWPFFAVAEAELVRLEEGPFQALQRLQSRVAEAAARGSLARPSLMNQIRSMMVDLATYCGLYETADELLVEADLDSPLLTNSAARLALFRGDADSACRFLRGAAEPDEDKKAQMDRWLLCALSAYASGNMEESLAHFGQFAKTTEQVGSLGEFSRVPYVLLQELAVLARQQGMIDFVAEIEGLPLASRVDSLEELSASQGWILAYLLEGMSNLEIAEALPRSENTVKSHLQSIYRKLGVENRQQAVVKATRLGLLEKQADVQTWQGLLSRYQKE